jgi:hypothetical protein
MRFGDVLAMDSVAGEDPQQLARMPHLRVGGPRDIESKLGFALPRQAQDGAFDRVPLARPYMK